ncbi:helix-turn-helix transcriptional regulator [Microcoleus sp. B4-D4]|uniref:helix-turn-helix transcriptional regulator n=1 Tax=Microcoleus sp. B4-D4 TaxID=2818667 RepID=UPI002FD70D79
MCYDLPQNKQTQESKDIPALQIWREAVGLSQSALAKQIPDKTGAKTLSQQAISKWERGLDKPELTIAQMKALCKALGKTLNDLPNDLGPQNPDQ